MPRKIYKKQLRLISFHIPEEMLKMVDELVSKGRYSSRAEALRAAVKLLITFELTKSTRTIDELGRTLVLGR